MQAVSESIARAGLRRLRWIGAFLALAGLGAIFAHVFGILEMPYFLSFIGVPSLLLLLTLAEIARRTHVHVFLSALRVGLIAGLAATLVYDGVRLALNASGVFDYDGFRAIYLFGSWMTRTDPSSVRAAIGGWTYHFWNGVSFGIFYALAVGRAHWLWGVAYGLVMEAIMLGLFPSFLEITNPWDFVAISMIGHLFYGLVLGVVVQRYGYRWNQ